MKPKKLKLPPLHLACSRENFREGLNYIYINKGIATATDAHIMVRYSLTEFIREDVLNDLDGKMIHMDTWKSIKDAANLIMVDMIPHYVTESWGVVKLPTKLRAEITHLDWEKVWNTKQESKLIDTIGLDTRFLNVLGQIINFNKPGGLMLKFIGEHKPIFAYPTLHYSAMGIIMPIMIGDSLIFNQFDL